MRARPLGSVLLAFAAVLAGCVSLPVVPSGLDLREVAALADPLAPGPLGVASAEYDFGTARVGVRDPYSVAVKGVLHHPTEGAGPFPVVVLLHGQHATCEVADQDLYVGTFCPEAPPAWGRVPNHRGYDYLAEHLASHGFVVASVDANDVNDRNGQGDVGMRARGELVLATLDALRDAGADGGLPDGLAGRLDLSRVGLMGHSRGGEGVVTALAANADRAPEARHALRSVVALAATDFNDVAAPDVAFLALLPYCDADVFSLEGAHHYDASRYLEETRPAPKVQLLVMGASHNVYNSEWAADPLLDVVPLGDDGMWNYDSQCRDYRTAGGARILPADARREATLHVNGFFRWTVAGEVALAPYFTGAADVPPAACPGGAGPCRGFAHVSYHAPPADRLVVERVDEGTGLERNALGGRVVVDGLVVDACEEANCTGRWQAGNARQLLVAWDGPGAYRTEIPPGHGDVSGFHVLSFRAAVPWSHSANPRGEPQDLTIVLEDAAGRAHRVVASEASAALYYPPGTTELLPEDAPSRLSLRGPKTVLNEVRLPLALFEGVDLTSVRAVTLEFDRTPRGAVQVTDLMFRRERA